MTVIHREVVKAPAREWQHYAQYRYSGVKWLGEVPAHWRTTPLRYVFDIVGGSTPSSGVPEYWEGDIPWVTPEDLGRLTGDTITITKRQITETGYRSCGTALASAGSLVLSTRAPIGHIAVTGVELCTNQGCKALIFKGSDCTRFFYYQLLAARSEIKSWGQGSTFQELGRSKLNSILVVRPPILEQEVIATFLDRETAKIDDLIAKRERLIDLLEEKRTALITRAVTKGLDPKVPMKDSGVEWLGKVPSHWNVKRAKHITSLITSGSRDWSQYYSDEGAVFLRIGNLTRTSINLKLDDVQRVDLPDNIEGRRTLVKENDLVLSITAFIGSVAVARDVGEAFVNQHIALARLRRDLVNERWVAYSLFSRAGQSQFRLSLYGGTKDGLGLDDVKNLIVPTPPPHEQDFIVNFVEKETAKIDALVGKVREHIEKLREYRTALISAAVTGKIDVREET